MANNRDNSGTLGANRNKIKPNHPSHRGSAIINGEEYYISAWIKDGQNGRFFSLSFQKKSESGGAHTRTDPTIPSYDDFDDDIPF